MKLHKENLKKYILTFVFSLLSFMVFAEDSENEPEADFSESQIILPEVTSSADGESMIAGKDAVLDFSNVLPSSEEISSSLPVLPYSPVVQEEQSSASSQNEEASQKSVYIEGLLGGGYPGYFTGDFSVYKNSGDSPFLLKFMHESVYGYAQNLPADGYFDSTTVLHGEKKFTAGTFNFKFDADYDTSCYGLQSKSDAFFDLNTQTISSSDYALWQLPHNFALKLNFNGEYYTRYGGKILDSVSSLKAQESKADVLTLNPSFSAMWRNDFLHFDLSSAYNFEGFLSPVEFSEENESPQTAKIHRGEFDFTGGFVYNNEENFTHIDLSVLGGIVIGNEIGETLPVIPRALLNFVCEGKYGAASRSFNLNVSGGLDSYLENFSALEKAFKFTSQSYLPSETSVWFASIDSSFPIASSFTFDFAGEIKKPLWGNGLWEASYSDALTSGLYSLYQYEDYLFGTQIGISYLWNILNISLNYKSNWLHVPSNEYPHLVNLNFSYDSDDGTYGFSLDIAEGLGGLDYIPVINALTYYRLKNSIRLALEVNDAVKLFSGTNRMWASSAYEQSSGNVTFLIKFFF